MDRKEIFNSIMISVMLICNSISMLFSFIPNGIVLLIYVPFFSMIVMNVGHLKKQVYARHLIFIIYILLFFLIPFSFGNFEPQLFRYFLDFFVFGIPFLFLPFFPINYSLVFKTITVLGLVLIPILLNRHLVMAGSGIWMATSYNVIKLMIPALIVIFFPSRKLSKLIGMVVFLSYSAFLLTLGSRGAILGLIFAAWLIYIYRKNIPLNIISKKVLLNMGIILILIVFFPYLIKGVVSFLTSHDIYSYSLERMVINIESNTSQSNTREPIYRMAIEGFFENPIFGMGIASFDNYSPTSYPHNLFLQQLYEGGILLFLPFFVLTFKGVFLINGRAMPIEKRQFIIYLVSAGIIHLLFSSYFWMTHFYWYLLGFSLQKRDLR